MTKVFTEDEVIMLCTAIRNRPSLYNPADANFGKSLANKTVWDEIAAMFSHKQFTADDVKLKWKNLRDTMALLLRKSNRDPNTWRFYEYCSFLNNYERPPRKNAKKMLNSTLKSEKMSTTMSLKSETSEHTDTSDEPPEKQSKPTMVVSAKTEDVAEPSDNSRDTNFEDTHDSLLKHFVSNSHPHVNTNTALVQTPTSQVQSPYPQCHSRDVFDLFGEETAMRLRSIDASGNRTLFVLTRRKINETLDAAELEIYAKQNVQTNPTGG